MKKLSKLKLKVLNEQNLMKKEMDKLKGGSFDSFADLVYNIWNNMPWGSYSTFNTNDFELWNGDLYFHFNNGWAKVSDAYVTYQNGAWDWNWR
jgi:natural product precursor